MRVIVFLMMCISFNKAVGQAIYNKQLRVFFLKKYKEGHVVGAVDLIKKDSFYFISLRGSVKKVGNCSLIIKKGNTYSFQIINLDSLGGYPPPQVMHYQVRLGNIVIPRLGYNGRSITSTQFLALNTRGLCVYQENVSGLKPKAP